MSIEALQAKVTWVVKSIERLSNLGQLAALWLKDTHPELSVDAAIWPEPHDTDSIESMCFDLCLKVKGPLTAEIVDELNDWLASKEIKRTLRIVFTDDTGHFLTID